ncbi:riboflavin kinase [Gaeumannomyces tritici R3-111a-1]|uniref:Riboflavin kinase n=1 Tax=Gaeumannomyces tritici (strain R3-111a-1) TaxID=644352 RepID=J3PGX8_GAET3|nr:riboflavin kinase [Gaeumannomyces tritici R3-111a-1]EJT69875.1 riboflavin kinase [Gaeumannomyces tritici R3-111a-1]
MSTFPMLRTSRSEASLRRRPTAPAQEPAVPSIPKFLSSKPPTPSPHHPAYANAGIGLGIRTDDLRPVRGPEDLFQDDSASSIYPDNDADSWNDEYAGRMAPKAIPPLPLRIPGKHAAGPDSPSPPLPPQGTVQRHVEVHTQEHTRHLQMRARTFTPVEVPGLTRPATASGTPVSLSPATPTSTHDGGAFPPVSTTVDAAAAAAAEPAKKNFFKKAAGDAALFAGGLLPHPVESARHHSIMRHSPAIVMYQGPETSVSVSVFADAPLPADRTLWLQQRGFTGDKGMRLKSLVGATGSWINVTPAQRAGVEAVPEGDERAFQRDVTKWLKKAAKAGGRVAKHAWRETHVVRIPAAAEDGYFRIILCSNANSEDGQHHHHHNNEYEDDAAGGGQYYYKKKVLCSSPVFRVASASTDVSILRGASVSTMPLEVGIKVASTVGVVYVSKYTKPVTMAAGAAQGTVIKKATTVVESKVKHSAAIARAGKMAYQRSGVQGELEGANARYRADGHAAGRYDALGAGPGAQVFGETTIGADDGPEAPFPLKFAGKVVRGSAASLTSGAGAPTANLDDVPEEVRQRLRGVYFGWACVSASGGSRKKPLDERVDFDWHPAVITAGPSSVATSRGGQAVAVVAARSSVAVHLLQDDLAGVEFFDVRLKVVLMGYLRPRLARDTPPAKQQRHLAVDSALTRASLARECWQPDVVRDFIREQKNARTIGDRLLGARDKAQMQMDRVPLHLLGVRTEASGLMDRAHGNGGYWISRG